MDHQVNKVENPFTEPKEAERYNLYRPVYHHLPFQYVSSYLGRRLGKSLDVACGTGHSTQAKKTLVFRGLICLYRPLA
ncbi:MAG: hypothetical protein AB7H97_04235 [Pseudobdellovibrionaceae bacterium]